MSETQPAKIPANWEYLRIWVRVNGMSDRSFGEVIDAFCEAEPDVAATFGWR